MSDRERTKMGTPRAEGWDTDWFRRVDMFERGIGRRVCGAHAPDGEPCELGSKHKNGRCRFHGGHPRIGGQRGNRNAETHGLYSRRFKQCGDGCPLWDRCPYAAEDVMGMSLKKRPMCYYEQRDYDKIIEAFNPDSEDDDAKKSSKDTDLYTSLLKSARKSEGANPYKIILDDTTALLYTMWHRAAAALSAHDLTEETSASGENYSMTTTKVSAIATAFLRIGRELQAHLKLRNTLVPEPDDDTPKSLPGLMKPIIEQGQPILDELIAEERERKRKQREAKHGTKGGPFCGPEPAPG